MNKNTKRQAAIFSAMEFSKAMVRVALRGKGSNPSFSAMPASPHVSACIGAFRKRFVRQKCTWGSLISFWLDGLPAWTSESVLAAKTAASTGSWSIQFLLNCYLERNLFCFLDPGGTLRYLPAQISRT